MRYLILAFLLTSFSVFALETEFENNSSSINCLDTSKKQHSKDNYYNCLDVAKKIKVSKKVKKVKSANTPAGKVTMGAAIIINPIAAAYWLIDAAINSGVDKTVNK